VSDDDLAALGAAFVEGDPDPISRSHLADLAAADTTLRSDLGSQVRTHLLLHALLQREAGAAVVRRARLIPGGFAPGRGRRVVDSARALTAPSSRRTSVRRWWLGAGTAGAAAALLVLVLLPADGTPALVSADAGVRIVRASGEAGSGTLQANDSLITAADQRAELSYRAEGTRIALQPNTRVQALPGSGKRFRLDHGAIAVRAAPQPASAPLVLQTAQAQATVVGTAFTLSSDRFLTWLAVERGSVRLTRHGGEELLVHGGQRALAADRLSPIPGDRGCGLIGSYFRGRELRDLAHMRLDPVIDFDWATHEPVAGVAHPFSVRWTGLIEARHAGTHRFYLPSDDGVRLWIDERLVYDNWRIQSFEPHDDRYGVFTFSDDRLRVPIRLEYYEQSSLAAVRLSWESPNQAREVVPANALHPVAP
jgi:ferric-dicitrate binding protein FerR (iron transport regulator)